MKSCLYFGEVRHHRKSPKRHDLKYKLFMPHLFLDELDLVFNFQKVYLLVDEFLLGGEVQDTSKRAIMERLAELERIKD